MSIEEIERYIRKCTYVDPDSMSVGGVHNAALGIALANSNPLIAPEETKAETSFYKKAQRFMKENWVEGLMYQERVNRLAVFLGQVWREGYDNCHQTEVD